MRNILNTVENAATILRLVIGLTVSGVILYFTATTAFAPQLDDGDPDGFDAQIERAQQNARAARIDRDLASEGWGSAPPASFEGRSRDADGEMIGGWGDETQ